MKTSYEAALSRLLHDEGGYSNLASDPGGPTNWGITLADARLHWKPNATSDDVRKMPLSVAKGIYRAKYWDAQRCDELPAGVDYCVFDYGVNSGIGRSGRILRRKLGMSDATSAVTTDVVATASRVSAASLVVAICDERLSFLHSLSTWSVFGRGWNARVNGVRSFALNLAKGAAVVVEHETPPIVVLDGQLPPKPAAPPAAPRLPSITNPAKGSIGAWIASLFAAIFKRKA